MPLSSNGCPARSSAPLARLVMSELTTISVIGVLTSLSWLRKRSTIGNLPRGTRYADFIQNPSKGLVTALIDEICFIQYVAVQPGTTMRAGYPFQCGSGASFICHAISVFSSIAFHTGSDFLK